MSAKPYEVCDPLRGETWIPVLGSTSSRDVVKEFLSREGYQARNHDELTFLVRHPTTAPTVYVVKVTVPRPAFKIGKATVRP